MTSIRKNVLANYVGQGWSAIVSLAFVPFYIKCLGIESYGLIGVFTIILNVMTLLDGGMTPTLNREMARLSAGAVTIMRVGNLLRSLETVFLLALITVVTLVYVTSGWLSSNWFGTSALPQQTVRHAICLMTLVAALRLTEGLYRGGLYGLQHHVWLNVWTVVLATIRGAGAAIVVAYNPTIMAFFVWQLAASVLSILVLASGMYAQLSVRGGRRFHASFDVFKDVGNFASGVFLTSIMGVALTQTDKILLSRLLPLKAFGYYTVAATVSNALYQLISPMAQAFYPRFTELVARKDLEVLARSYHRAAQLLSFVIGSAAMVLMFFAQPVLLIWTRDQGIALQSAQLLALLTAGTLLHGLLHMPYMLQLAYGWSGFSAKANAVAVVLLIPAIFWAVPRYGGVGAATIWVILNAGYMLVTMQLMHRRILPQEKWKWYANDILAPLGATAAAAAIIRYGAYSDASAKISLSQIVAIALILYAVAALATVEVRYQARKLIGRAA
jgi:O-antigen/teichoic acid export membrane protein